MKKTIGIIGGMGPEATVDLFNKIIRLTPVKKDQDHIRILIDNNTAIPDRTKAILKGGTDPLPELVKSAKLLKKAGADFIIMPCNTAHYFYDGLKKSSGLPVIHMIEEVAKHLKGKYKKAGLLATDGTVQSGIYTKVLNRYGIELVIPGKNDQKKVMALIYGKTGIKSGSYKEARIKQEFLKIIKNLAKQGAETVIMGCTEIPVILRKRKDRVPLIDSTQILAESAVKKALNNNI